MLTLQCDFHLVLHLPYLKLLFTTFSKAVLSRIGDIVSPCLRPVVTYLLYSIRLGVSHFYFDVSVTDTAVSGNFFYFILYLKANYSRIYCKGRSTVCPRLVTLHLASMVPARTTAEAARPGSLFLDRPVTPYFATISRQQYPRVCLL